MRSEIIPTITPDVIEDQISEEAYYVFPGTTVTVCLLTLKNTYSVIGESVCPDPRIYNKELGKKKARDNAKNKLFSLEGYHQRSILAGFFEMPQG